MKLFDIVSYFCSKHRLWVLVKIIIIMIIIIMIIIISIFKEDNVFSITASLPYGPPVNTDIDYYQTFFGLVYFLQVLRC